MTKTTKSKLILSGQEPAKPGQNCSKPRKKSEQKLEQLAFAEMADEKARPFIEAFGFNNDMPFGRIRCTYCDVTVKEEVLEPTWGKFASVEEQLHLKTKEHQEAAALVKLAC